MADMDMSEGHQHHNHNGAVHIQTVMTARMWLHLVLIGLAFGVVLPYGFVCKQAKSRRHLVVMLIGGAMTVLGAFFGHISGVDHYNPFFVDLGAIYALACVGGSVLLLIYMPKGILATMRSLVNRVHIALCLIQPLFCWVTTGLGVISLLQYCKSEGDHTGQCLAHGIMGTAFITYGIMLLAMLFVGERFLKRMNRCQEYYDSLIITLWGIVNTFTEHRWGHDWNHGDIQHTSMGVVWWAAGMLGIYMSWDRVNDRPRRNHVPAFVIIITGYAMMTHVQSLQVSTDIHFMFGVALMLSGVCRMIEISFVVNDKPQEGTVIRSWQFLTPFLLVLSGMLFMSATEEAMQFLDSQQLMAAPYVLIIASVASLIFLDGLFLLQAYKTLQPPAPKEHVTEGIELRPFLREGDVEAAREFDISE